MRQAERSEQSKRMIMESATHLFYEYGYTGTTYGMISGDCGITAPLINYHFGSKARLGGEVFGNYCKQQINTLFRKAYEAGESDVALISTAYIILTVRYYAADPKAFAFYWQLFDDSFTLLPPGIESIMHLGQKPSKNDLDPIKRMRYISSQYAARGLIYHWVIGTIACSQREFETYFAMCMSDNKLPEDRLYGAFNLLDRIEIRYENNFQFS